MLPGLVGQAERDRRADDRPPEDDGDLGETVRVFPREG